MARINKTDKKDRPHIGATKAKSLALKEITKQLKPGEYNYFHYEKQILEIDKIFLPDIPFNIL